MRRAHQAWEKLVTGVPHVSDAKTRRSESLRTGPQDSHHPELPKTCFHAPNLVFSLAKLRALSICDLSASPPELCPNSCSPSIICFYVSFLPDFGQACVCLVQLS